MNKTQAKERIKKLKKLIDKYRYAYHVLDKPLVSDAVNDSLKHELQELEDKFPEFVTPDSPTQRVGGEPLDKFQKVQHQTPMLSLVDAFSFDEVKAWEERLGRLVADRQSLIALDYYVELKMDGLAVSLVYENGILKYGATRGDGRTGEDVTQNLKTIEAIPLRLKKPESKLLCVRGLDGVLHGRFEVRGEVFMTRKALEEINKEQEKKGQPKFANPRNAAAGSIRQLNPKITATRKLDCYIYVVATKCGLATHEEEHQLARELGFKVNPNNRYCQNLEEVRKFYEEWSKKRETLLYQIDGVVVTVNKKSFWDKLGVVGKAPRYMLAYKFAPEETTTVIQDIIVSVGRTGALTPVAVLKPVAIAGSTVSRATLHNLDEIKRKDIKIGDTVVVHKAGDVIPEVASVLKEMRTGKEKTFQMPKKCPVCGGEVKREAGKVAYRCIDKNCYTIRRRALQHFVSRAAFDIVGLGPKILEKFMEEGIIEDAADLFQLKTGDIEPLERFAEKSAQNIVDSIKAHKKINLARFIYALGIPNVGEETAYDLAEKFGSVEKLKKANFEEIDSVREIGQVVAESIYQFFQDKKNSAFIEKLLKVGVEIQDQKLKIKNQKLSGLTFVFTGELKSYTRDEAKNLARAAGAEVSEAVSKKTSYVVAGQEPGSKYDKAKKLGMKIISEEEFKKLVR